MAANAKDTQDSPPKPSITRKLREISLPAAVLDLDSTEDGSVVVTACQDGGVYRVDLERGLTTLIARHSSYASGVVLLPETNTAISSSYSGVLQWHDLKTKSVLRTVLAHQFWSWDLARSADGRLVASVTGRYQAGGPKYEPAPEVEPSVKVFEAASGKLLHQFAHVPPTQAVAISHNGNWLAAGNLMGEIRVWDLNTGAQVSQWTNSELTSWGVIKSHHYLGGVFALAFSPDDQELYACGMGPMVDPMAGNGVQRWQRFSWRDGKKIDQTHEGESGQGLMESLAFHPGQKVFAMAGRLFQGTWNLAFFDAASGKNLHSLDAKHRITSLQFIRGGTQFLLGKARQQDRPKDGKWPDYGLLEIHEFREDLLKG